MSLCTKITSYGQRFADRLNARLSEKQRQWLWFVGLWCGGLLAVTTLGYAIKFLMFVQL